MSDQEQNIQALNIPSQQHHQSHPGRIRSHSLKPQHSRLDYARRKSATDVASSSSSVITCLESSNEDNDQLRTPTKIPLPSWFKRRFTLFSLEKTIQGKRRMTSDCLYTRTDKTSPSLLQRKRPSGIAQMLESFVRRLSSRKKKHHYDREEDQTVVDPVYETLKVAAETRKKTIANYLQQRQQSLNQPGSTDCDVQSTSPKITRQSDTNASVRSRPGATAASPSPSGR